MRVFEKMTYDEKLAHLAAAVVYPWQAGDQLPVTVATFGADVRSDKVRISQGEMELVVTCRDWKDALLWASSYTDDYDDADDNDGEDTEADKAVQRYSV